VLACVRARRLARRGAAAQRRGIAAAAAFIFC
jgi:hypothetical protein